MIATAPDITTTMPTHRFDPLVLDPARGDALVDDVGLLEEQLPRRDRGSDYRDDQQQQRGVQTARERRDDALRGLGDVRVHMNASGNITMLIAMSANRNRSSAGTNHRRPRRTAVTAASGTEIPFGSPK